MGQSAQHIYDPGLGSVRQHDELIDVRRLLSQDNFKLETLRPRLPKHVKLRTIDSWTNLKEASNGCYTWNPLASSLARYSPLRSTPLPSALAACSAAALVFAMILRTTNPFESSPSASTGEFVISGMGQGGWICAATAAGGIARKA